MKLFFNLFKKHETEKIPPSFAKKGKGGTVPENNSAYSTKNTKQKETKPKKLNNKDLSYVSSVFGKKNNNGNGGSGKKESFGFG